MFVPRRRRGNKDHHPVQAATVSLLESLPSRLLAEPPPPHPVASDYDLNPGLRPPPRPLTAAAVLIAIVAKPEPSVLFTERSRSLKRHAGQISFPGGRADPADASPAATALRELHEETGIAAAYVTIAGYLEVYETVTGFAVQPVVGLLKPGFSLVPDRAEVADIFEVPLAVLLDPAACRRESRMVNGVMRHTYAFHYQGRYIWGATAAMLKRLADRLA